MFLFNKIILYPFLFINSTFIITNTIYNYIYKKKHLCNIERLFEIKYWYIFWINNIILYKIVKK